MKTRKLYNHIDDYYKDHKVCPKCGSKVSSTYMGYVFYKGKPFKDENECTCKCGWEGICDDLVKEN